MLEAFQSLRDEFTSFQKTSKQPEVEVDQTSASASKPDPPNQVVTLDPPPPRPQPTSLSVEAMEVDCGPSLPPRLGADQSQHQNASDQHSGLSHEPNRAASARPKKHPHSHKNHDIEPRSTSDQYSGQSNEPRVASSRPKHADRSKHKVRFRYVSSSSEEDQSSAPRHRSSKPSRAHSDQDQPEHDPDPPYYREVALSDVPFNMLRKWTPLDVFLTSLIPGSPCLGPPLLSWGWLMRKADRSLVHKALLLSPPQLSYQRCL